MPELFEETFETSTCDEEQGAAAVFGAEAVARASWDHHK
jgi:hypothetical protein